MSCHEILPPSIPISTLPISMSYFSKKKSYTKYLYLYISIYQCLVSQSNVAGQATHAAKLVQWTARISTMGMSAAAKLDIMEKIVKKVYFLSQIMWVCLMFGD